MKRNLKSAVYKHLNFANDFQNFFDFPDFREMRPIIREAVQQLAKDRFSQPVLPVKILQRCRLRCERLQKNGGEIRH